MTCLYNTDFSPGWDLFFLPLSVVHTWATSMLMDVTRQPQPQLRSVLLRRRVKELKLTSKPQLKRHDAKLWLKSVPGQLGREE